MMPGNKKHLKKNPARGPTLASRKNHDKLDLAVSSVIKRDKKTHSYDIRKSIGNALFLAVFFLVVARVLCAVAGLPSPFAVVASRSMEPTLSPGDIVIWSPVRVEDVSIGDVIVFQSVTSDEYIVHRVVDITTTSEGKRGFITQGDANAYPDQSGPSNTIQPVVTERTLLGRVISLGDYPLKVPFLGSVWLWFTHAFPSSPKGIAFISYAIAGVIIVLIFIAPSEKPEHHTIPKKVISVILGRRQVKLLSLGIAFLLLVGLVLASASAGNLQESSVSIGVRQKANPATLRIDHLTWLESINASLTVENPSGVPLRGMIFVTGEASEFIPLTERLFDIAPYQVLNISIPVKIPANVTQGAYDGRITIYFSAFWYLFPSDAAHSLMTQYGPAAITIINMVITLEITLIFFGVIYLILWSSHFLEPYFIYIRMKGVRRVIRTKRLKPSFSRIRETLNSIRRWVSTIPLIPVDVKEVLFVAFTPLIFLPLSFVSLYFVFLSGVVMGIVTRIYFRRAWYESLASGIFAVAITLLSTFALTSLLITIIVASPLVGLLAYFVGMRYRGEIIMTAEVFSLTLILGVMLLPVILVPPSGSTMVLLFLQGIGVSLVLYLIVFIPVLVLVYIPPLVIHPWKEYEEPTIKVKEPSDL